MRRILTVLFLLGCRSLLNAETTAPVSSATGGRLIGLSIMSGDAQGASFDGRTMGAMDSMDGGNTYMAYPCDKYDGEQYDACTDGYRGMGCASWSGDDWWACEYGQMAAQDQSNQSGDGSSAPASTGGGGGGAVDPASLALYCGFAALGAAAKRRRRS